MNPAGAVVVPNNPLQEVPRRPTIATCDQNPTFSAGAVGDGASFDGVTCGGMVAVDPVERLLSILSRRMA